ncbi:Ig-like domain-containing protein [Psychrobacter namhaensis]|jgi:hypothetical protein|uniref:Ig-like domain-containing protein n=1 Tax=Psychrobacter namhaensis TaxID=292734 RepID=UPI0018DFB295|nr:Ig-like domain-containing protein [Psychrobacter namhaensis]
MSYPSLPFTSKLFQLTALTLSLALAGCGGGDGGTDILPPVPDVGVQSGTDGTGVAVGEVNISAITLTDTNGNMTNVVTSAGASAKVTVTDESSAPISNALVTFAGDGVIFGTSNATVLTNENGEASISISPIDSTTTGAYQMTATASYNNETATTAGYNFSLQPVNVLLTDLVLSSINLNSGASTNLTLKTKDATNNVNQNGITVDFDTTCGTFDSDSVVSSNQGDISVTYKSIDADGNLCEGNQTITATPANNTAAKQTVSVTIASIEANSIVYTTDNSVELGASNSGSSSSGQIVFTVFANGIPAANQQVTINKVFAPADLSFVTLGNRSSKTVTSDSDGNVTVNLYPGALPGPVEIKASLVLDPTIFALSKDVSVATGRATQSGVSISLSKNVLANSVDGDTATVTARLVDRVGNPVSDGTVVSFVSEGGRVTPNCATANGVCSVEFSTQNPRPADSRVSVIAFVEGDKSYTDVDGDNQFSVGDIFTHNIGDFFRDDNENNQYDSPNGEFVYRRGVSGATCAPSSFNQPNILGTCDDKLTATLRYQFVLGLADSAPLYSGLPSTLAASAGTAVFQMYGNSARTISMASGTTISVEGDGPSGTCEAEIVAGYVTVPSIVNLQGGTSVVDIDAVSYAFSYSDCVAGDKVKVTVQTPAPAATTTTTTISIT